MNRPKEIAIESSLDEMFRIEQFVEEISDEFLLYGNYFGNILMALTEAVRNAILHGNGADRRKHVKIYQEIIKEGLLIRVTDEGDGFDFKSYMKNLENWNEQDQGKNGLFLIQKLTDEITFLNNGKTIEMLFRINGIDENIFNRRAAFMQDFFRVYQRLNS
jgi:serine/threonine-protein kinase RsbW